MMIIDNQVVLSNEDRAVEAFRRYVEAGHEIEYHSFIEGYFAALGDLK